MESRLELHEILCKILGTRNVYFQPPASIEMEYPAIRYSRKIVKTQSANNKTYRKTNNYDVVLIDYDPDSEFFDKILELPCCTHETSYTADNLNHDKFTLQF